MTVGKAAALTAAFVGVFAVGVAVGPSVRESLSIGKAHVAVPSTESAAATATAPAASASPAKPSRPRATPSARKATAPGAVESNAAARPVVPASEPRLHARLKPVLQRGARMDVAAQGFRSGEEFATVAHAARNTEVPFMVLKHRVLVEGRTLAESIHETKPEIDAKAEVARAAAAAKADIETVG